MNQTNDLLLAPPFEPAAPVMSFLEPGWMAVYVALAIILLFIAARMVHHYRKNAYRRTAIRALHALSLSEPSSLLKAMAILKSTAMKSYGRVPLAHLTGTALLGYFNRIYPAFDPHIVEHLVLSIYSDTERLNREAYLQFIKQSQKWISKHDI